MPYIKKSTRELLDTTIDKLHKALVDIELDNPNSCMEDNISYIITRIIRMCYDSNTSKEMNFAVGILQRTLQEYHRTVVAPFEEQRKFDNGDIENGLGGEMLEEIIINHKVVKNATK